MGEIVSDEIHPLRLIAAVCSETDAADRGCRSRRIGLARIKDVGITHVELGASIKAEVSRPSSAR